ncbi:MAG: hypothetical protein FJX75_12260 [Armatimonadetes bacterium]|nr:hypothetical protein [Armatimonadota bacterium]
MTCAKLLLIVTNIDARRRLLATWHDFVIRQPGTNLRGAPGAVADEAPVAFSRLSVRPGLDLAVFVVDGGWRREYVCRALAAEVEGYCLLLGDSPADLSLAHGLLQLLGDTTPGVVAGTAAGSDDLIREVLALPPDTVVPVVDCDDRESVTELVCMLLERVAILQAV